MKNYSNKVLAPEDVGGHGGSAASNDGIFSPSPDAGGSGGQFDDAPGTSPGKGGDGTDAPAAPAPAHDAPLTLTQEQLQALVSATAKEVHAAATPPAQPPTMTQEEFEKRFNVVKVQPDVIETLLDNEKDIPSKVAALQELLHGTARMATTIAAYQMAAMRQELEQRMTPALTLVEQQREEALANKFFESYPDLKEYRPLLVMVRDQLVKEGRSFATVEEAFKEVATRANAVLKSIPGAQQATSQRPTGGPARLSGGGQVTRGADTPSGDTPATQLARKIFG